MTHHHDSGDKTLNEWYADVHGTAAPHGNGNGKPTRADLRYQILAGAVDVISGARGIGGVAWPWATFQHKIGPMIPGRLYVWGARPSNGKTSALLSILDGLHAGQVSTIYFGTEMEPETLMTKWALARLGHSERYLAHHAWDELTREQRARLESELEALATGPVIFPRCLRLDQTVLEDWLAWAFTALDAAERPPQVVILDHLHQLRTEGREDPNTAVHRAILALKDLSVDRRVVMLVASQLRRPDRSSALDLYVPPNLSQFKGASAIEECADLALGSWRRLKPGLRVKDEKAIARGELSIRHFVEPNAMGVICLKARFLGELQGEKMTLTVDHGRVRDVDAAPPLDAGDAWEADELPF